DSPIGEGTPSVYVKWLTIAAYDMSAEDWTTSIPDFSMDATKNVNDVDTYDFSVAAGGVINIAYTRRVADDTLPFTIQTATYNGTSWSSEVAAGTEYTYPIQTGTTIGADGTLH